MQAPRRRHRRATLVGFAVLAASLVAVAAPSGAAAGQAEGIDVSHHQGTIDWTKVAGAGKRFAFLKATQGTGFRDPNYATNRSNANAAGIPTGSYHFADVTYDPNAPANLDGARAEADWFVDVAQPKAGDLPPVFDIETNNGLGQVALTNWAMAWLQRVRQRTGIYPMVYTSPNGWNTRFGTSGNTVAESGYGLLWVAHWTTNSSPTVPANNWAGNGWTFWQYSSTGRVNGISGDVDLDRYEASDVGPLLLRSLSITKVSVEGKIGGVQQDGLGGFCNAACMSTSRLSVGGASTTLSPQSGDAGTTWVWGGACAGAPTGGTCTLAMTENRSVTITYAPTTEPVTVAAAGTGSGSIASTPAGISCTATSAVASGTCSASFPYGSTVSLTATPASGSAFTGWTGACTGTGACSVTADAARNVTATFGPASFALALTRSGTGTGTTTASAAGGVLQQSCAASCTWTYPAGTTVPVAALAAADARFVGWSGACVGTSACAPVMTANRGVNAIFAKVVTRALTPSSATVVNLRKGQTFTVTGALTSSDVRCAIGSQTVGLWLGGATSALATTRTTSTGAYTISRKMQSTGQFTFVVRATEILPATLGDVICGAAASATITVNVSA